MKRPIIGQWKFVSLNMSFTVWSEISVISNLLLSWLFNSGLFGGFVLVWSLQTSQILLLMIDDDADIHEFNLSGFILFILVAWVLQETTRIKILRYIILFIGKLSAFTFLWFNSPYIYIYIWRSNSANSHSVLKTLLVIQIILFLCVEELLFWFQISY